MMNVTPRVRSATHPVGSANAAAASTATGSEIAASSSPAPPSISSA